eukprot:gb/GECG01008812.1/.p1 GENE.gb/GECG01008812.1/~~gb/GECG01008812.1/.p1  ORF type:complete len:191 (+),score=30.29 gb/GECG01008812.1/:1-573(+)
MPLEALELSFEAFPEQVLYVALWENVGNSGDLLDQIIQASKHSDDAAGPPDGAYLDADNCAGIDPLHLAAYKALIADHKKETKSHTVYSEILFNMSQDKHIAPALRKFGISEETKRIVFATFEASSIQRVRDFVSGDIVAKDDIRKSLDIETSEQRKAKIRKIYDVNDEELAMGSVAEAIMSRLAGKSIF